MLAIALSCACGASASPDEGASTEPAPAATCALETTHLIDERTLHGVVDTPPDRRASVAAEVPGRIERVLVREGDVVEAGALLAQIEAGPTVDAQAHARAQLAEAETLAHTQQASRDHLAHLVERGIAARAQLEEADGHLAALEEAVTAARAIFSEARRGVARTHVTSPIAGTVVRMLRRTGENVDGTPATPILEIADVSSLEITVSAPARDLLVLARDQTATVVLDGLAEPVTAHVRTVAPALDPVTGTGSVRVALDPSARTLPLGLAAEVRVAIGEHDALTAPESAVRHGAEGSTEVLVCADGHAVPTPVTVGARIDGRAEIASGLPPAARVVVRSIGLPDDAPCEGAERP